MSLQVWFPKDVIHILNSIEDTNRRAMRAMEIGTPASADYEQGFGDAIQAVRMAFGVEMVGTRTLDCLYD
jgi:2-methylisocitrate lyase-like PEP mutase family enzyme